jgi:hypothetical protein
MRFFLRASIAATTAVLLIGASAVSASAATTANSTATATVAGGVLSISVPASVALSSSGPGVDATGTVGTVTVTDDRASIDGWAASVATTAFHSSAAGTADIPATNFTYAPTPADTTGSAGTVAVTRSTVTGGTAAAVQTATASGNNVASWTAGVTLVVPASALAADYTATITHSVL